MTSSRFTWALPLMTALALASLCSAVAAAAPDTAPDAQALLRERQLRLQALTPEQRAVFEQRLSAWEALPRTVREGRRARYRAWRSLDAAERAQLRASAARIAMFPPERVQALRAQFDALNETQRRGWRLGTALGADYPQLHPLLAYVPERQRETLLAALRAMNTQQRADLAVLSQRTPPQARQTLRVSLLAIPPAQRGVWLQRKLRQ